MLVYKISRLNKTQVNEDREQWVPSMLLIEYAKDIHRLQRKEDM